MTDNKAVFTLYEDKYVLIHIENDQMKHIYVYNSSDEIEPGTVINCRIDRGIDNIDSCFVQYGPKSTGFLNKKYKNGTVIPLVYKKEAINNKKPMFSDSITLEGEYVVVTDKRSYVKVSSKIPEPAKKDIAGSFYDLCANNNAGVIIRTRTYTEEDGITKAIEEFNNAVNMIGRIIESSQHLPQYSVLYRPVPAFVSDILYLSQRGLKEVITDIPQIMDRLKEDHDTLTGRVNLTDRVELRFYDDKLVSLGKLYSIDAKISSCLSRKVYLKSGAYITIDTTEAFTAIDVNTASSDRSATRDETFLAVNLEACSEIAKQLVLRNIGGMVIIDFINMESEEDYNILTEHIKNTIKFDRVKCRFVDFTGLKLCELTRSRQGKSLYQNLRGR